MSTITRGQRLYFAAVGLLAVWVGIWGTFAPAQVARAIPWTVPPLHARFLGAMYLSGATFMAGCLLARRGRQVRLVVPMAATWTGLLLLVSLAHLEAFDRARVQTWIWFAAYLAYPLVALWLAWRNRDAWRAPDDGAPPPAWSVAAMTAFGAAFTGLGIALLVATTAMVAAWPWPITPLLARLYAAPLLAYGLGGLTARRAPWSEARIVVVASLVFCALVLVASTLHRALFMPFDVAAALWFGGFGAAVLALAAVLAARQGGGRADGAG